MKKFILWLLLILGISTSMMGQKYLATIGIDDVDLKKNAIGEDVIIPIRLIEKSGGLFSILQFYIDYDHALLRWKGSYQNPLPGINKFHINMSYTQESWAFNDNGYEVIALWNDPKFQGVNVETNEVMIELIFTIVDKLALGNTSTISFSTKNEYIEGRQVRGVTEIIDETSINSFQLSTRSGIIHY
jgi:hypothetical protein